MGIVTKRVNEFPTPYTCRNAIQKGGPETKLSMILMGLGNFVHGQKIKGLLYLAVEVAYIVFMAVNGITFLSMLGGLGSRKKWGTKRVRFICTQKGISRS